MSSDWQVPEWLSWVDPEQHRAVEIGALDKPLLRDGGVPVTYVDHATTEGLREKYADDEAMRGRLDLLVPVDYVWSGDAPLQGLLDQMPPVDVVVASHVIEHVPDLIGWLGQVEGILVDGGTLALAIPDMRFCFDANRDLTTMADLVDANLRRLDRPSIRQVYDFHSRIVPVDATEVWEGRSLHAGTWRIDLDPDAWAMELCQRQQEGEYVDGHCQVFTPASFVDLLERMSKLGMVGFAMASISPTPPKSLEFHVLLEKLPADLDLAARLERQLADLATAREVLAIAARPPGSEGQSLLEGHQVKVVSLSEARFVDTKRRVLHRVRLVVSSVRRWVGLRRRTSPRMNA